MDVIANNLISIFTDNRSEGGGNTVDVYSASTLIDIGGIDISLKAFLQGPYDVTGDTMETDLAQADLIPQQQPYNTAPWNYTGLEMIPGPTPLNIVDWVLVRLRTTTAAASIVATQAALLRNDGMIVAPDGTPMLNFVGLNDPNYYVEIIHRNHLNILSKNAVAVASKAPMLYGQLTYDFTTALTQVFGDDQRLLDTGVYGMYAGDLNSNNEIRYIGTGRDQLEIINVLGTSNLASTENGYYRADANLNGIVRYIGATRDQEPIIAVLGSSNLGSTKTSNVPN
jgi:hypothetical protein